MKICERHVQALRNELITNGLEAFMEGEHGEGNFNAFWGAYASICKNAINMAGFPVVMPNDDGSERCPICYIVESCEGGPQCEPVCQGETWPVHAAREARQAAVEDGLTPAALTSATVN